MDIDLTNIYSILIIGITVLGSGGAWKFYQQRALAKDQDRDFMKNDYKERIEKMESHLEKATFEKNELREKILVLTSEVSRLRVKVEFLEKENQVLTMLKNMKNGD